MDVYTPDSNRVIHYTYADMTARQIVRPIHLVQYDQGLPIIAVKLYNDGLEYTIPTNAIVNIRCGKVDGNFVYNPALGWDSAKHTVYFEVTKQMTALAGEINPIVEIELNNKIVSSGAIAVQIDFNPVQEQSIRSTTEYLTVKQYSEQAVDAAAKAAGSASAASVSASNAKKYADSLENMVPTLVSSINHRNIYRGKDLGSYVTEAQKTAIENGTFDDLFIGDYWVIGGVTWVIADMDYFLRCGDTDFTKHHLVIVPNTSLAQGCMYVHGTKEGAYLGSDIYNSLQNVNDAIHKKFTEAFGDMLLTHRTFLIKMVTDGQPNGGQWCDETISLMTEVMVYGAYHLEAARNGKEIGPFKRTVCMSQLALMRLNPGMINIRETYWLQNPFSNGSFVVVDKTGYLGWYGAAGSAGIRPYATIG